MPLLRRLSTISSLAGLIGLIALSAPAAASAAYVNPFSSATATVGRTDMGVDLCLNPGDAIRAIGDGTVTGIQRDWYAGQPYLWYVLSDGPHAGDYVYVAEQIDHLARVGQTLRAGDVLARYAKRGSCLETGWSMADGETEAAASTGYTEGQATPAGVSFARLLMSVGVTGQFELTTPKPQASRVKASRGKARRRQASAGQDAGPDAGQTPGRLYRPWARIRPRPRSPLPSPRPSRSRSRSPRPSRLQPPAPPRR